MAVKVITNACISGALAGMLAGKQKGATAPASYANEALVAKAIGTAFVTANAALTAPMADADNTEIGFLVEAAAFSQCFQTFTVTTVATDAQCVAIANEIAAMSKQTVAQLV